MAASVRRKPVPLNQTTPLGYFERPRVPHDYVEITETDADATGDDLHKERPSLGRTIFDVISHRSWLVEVSSCVVALISLAGIVVTLAVHQNRPLPQWPLKITINALVSFLTTIFKAAMMVPVSEGISQLKWLWYTKPHALLDLDRFDKASRGPWGSILLLYRPAKYYLTILGAIITIAALAVDPFSQLILTTHSCPAVDTQLDSWISRSNNYTAAGIHTGARQSSLDAPMTIAINEGLMNDAFNNTLNVPFSCAYGNCTFQDYGGAMHSFIGMCHTCADISDTIISFSVNEDAVYTLPRNTTTIGGDVILNVSSHAYSGKEVLGFDVLMFDATYHPFAYTCSMSPCVKTVWSNISNSQLQETELWTNPLIYANSVVLGDGGFWDWWSLANTTTLRQNGWEACNVSDHYTLQTPVAVVTENNTVAASSSTGEWQSQYETYPANITLSYYPADCVWYLGASTLQSLTDNLSLGPQYDLSVDAAAGMGIYGAAGQIWWSSLWHNGTATLTTVNAWWASLANSMSANMRARGDTPVSDYLHGTTHVQTICIGVRWEWLSLPATLALLLLVFQGSMMQQAQRSNVPRSWKSSVLPLLYHGLSEEVRAKHPRLSRVEDMAESAEHVRVQLGPVERDWLLLERP